MTARPLASALLLAADGTVHVADEGNNAGRMITPDGIILGKDLRDSRPKLQGKLATRFCQQVRW